MNYDRGDVVFAADPFRTDEDAGRPFCIISTSQTPFHGEQYICLSLTSRTWHEERIALSDSDWVEGGAPSDSSIMPWSVLTIRDEFIEHRHGTLTEEIIGEAIDALGRYIELA